MRNILSHNTFDSSTQKFTGNRIDPIKRLLTVRELADHYQVSAKTIYKWVDQGLIESEPAGPKLIRFDLEKVEQRLLKQKEQL